MKPGKSYTRGAGASVLSRQKNQASLTPRHRLGKLLGGYFTITAKAACCESDPAVAVTVKV
jgi:hypothetical protein